MKAEELARKIIEIIDGMGDNNLETISVIEKYCQKLILEKVNTGMFKAGAEWKKKQLVNRAIWCEAHPRDGEIWGSFEHLNLHECEKVRVIIIKDK